MNAWATTWFYGFGAQHWGEVHGARTEAEARKFARAAHNIRGTRGMWFRPDAPKAGTWKTEGYRRTAVVS